MQVILDKLFPFTKEDRRCQVKMKSKRYYRDILLKKLFDYVHEKDVVWSDFKPQDQERIIEFLKTWDISKFK